MARSLLTLSIVALVCLLHAPACLAQDAIAWTKDLRSALHTASREQKLVLLHFYSDDCRPCKTLEQNVLSKPEVAAAIHKNYVPVKVNASQMPDMAKHYNVSAWPTDLILTSAGLEVYRMISLQAAASYVTMLDQIAFQAGVGLAHESTGVAPPAASAAAGAQNSLYSNVALTGATAPAAQPGSQPSAVSQPSAASPWDADPRQTPYGPQQPATNHYAGQSYAGAQAAPAAPQMQHQQVQQPQLPQTPPAAHTEAPSSIYGAAAITPAPSAPPQSPPQSGLPVDQPWPASVAAPPRSDSQGSLYGQPSPQPQQSQVVGAGTLPPTQGQEGRVTSHQALAPRMIERSKAPPIAMEGFCPVTILESLNLPQQDPRFRKWQKGDPRFGAVHRNRTYLFTSAQAQQRFLADPDRYAPVLSGCDPVVFAETGKWVDGSSRWGVKVGDKMFLFASPQSLARFEQSPRTYTAPAYQAMAAEQSSLR